jgi:hypothetical protein
MGETYEEVKSLGEELPDKVNELQRQGNVRRTAIGDNDGKEVVSFPLTVGVIGAVAALVTDCTIVVERRERIRPNLRGRRGIQRIQA